MRMREYTLDDGTDVHENPNVCAGTDPTPGPAPFMKGCGNDTTYAETLEVRDGEQRYVLEYCEDHKHQMQRYE